MSLAASFPAAPPAVTQSIAEWVAGVPADAITPAARSRARHALLDWAGVTIAGAREPLTGILIEELAEAGPVRDGGVMLVAQGRKARLLDAALINGAASHALDYDDVVRAMGGHPTVPVAPVVLALGEAMGASGREVIDAMIVGIEVECALGDMTGQSHYELGFHNTGTLGAFGAAAAAARLMRLDAETTARALGLAASMAAGLKCSFGTMTKPFHAGRAAANGLLAARLAARGFTARTDAIETERGFAATQVPDFEPAEMRPDPSAPFAVERILFKYHAACYGTHATIEAIRALRARHGVGLDDLIAPGASLKIVTHTRSAGNCNIADPRTGLQLKFSIRHLAAVALDGVDTGALETYSPEVATDARYATARGHTATEFRDDIDRMTAQVVLTLADGRSLIGEGDVGTPARHDDEQWRRLSEKFDSLAVPVLGAARARNATAAIAGLEAAKSLEAIIEAIG